MKLWRSGIRLCARRARAPRRGSARRGAAVAALSGDGHRAPLGVGERTAAAAQQHEQVVEDVGGLLVDALVGLLARRARDLLGLLHDLLADPLRVVEQLDGVGARRGRSCARWAIVRSSAGSVSNGAPGSGRRGEKHVRSPVWQAGPAGSTSASSVSPSQSRRSARTPCTLPLVAPLCHSSPRERLHRCSSPVSRVRCERQRVHVGERQHLAGAASPARCTARGRVVEGDLRVDRRSLSRASASARL